MDIETEFMEEPCKNCGFQAFEVIDGYFYCTECNEQLENVVKKEFDEYAHENITIDKRGVKQKDVQKSLDREREAISAKKTSYEEYNFILYGLVNEILQIENIPNFKVTVLQIWIHYLKKFEVAFFENENLNHLPKLNTIFHEKDAQVLYNKKAKPPRKRKYYPKKKKVHTEKELNADTHEAKKLRKRLVKKSVKAIAKKQMESEMSSNTSTLSTLSNLTLTDITDAQKGIELAIESSALGKNLRKNILERKIRRGEKYTVDENGEPIFTMKDLVQEEKAQVMTHHVLFAILYAALNICCSEIQLTDLIRLCREGHVSFYNFRKFLPESLEKVKLSLEQFHRLNYMNVLTQSFYLNNFFNFLPELKLSMRQPSLVMLVRRYVADLNLPSVIGVYAERFMELIPSHMTTRGNRMANYEARAMGYLLFVLKYIFGIDGYREKEMSESARKINAEFKRLGMERRLFVYEDWRESMEYRKHVLYKYYFPSVFKTDFTTEKPYKSYLALLKTAKPMTFSIQHDDIKLLPSQIQTNEKKAYLKGVIAKVLKFHEHESEPRDQLRFDFSYTPQRDAIDVIMQNHQIEPTLKKDLLVSYTNTNCDFYLESHKLVALFEEKGLAVKTKKCTFPKNFCFKKIRTKMMQCTRTKVSFDICVDTDTWKKNFLDQERQNEESKEAARVRYHNKQMTKVLKKRYQAQKELFAKKIISELPTTDEIVAVSEEEEEEEGDEGNSLVFVEPDFNYWYQRLNSFDPGNVKQGEGLIRALPKSFQWLLQTAASTIQNEAECLFYELSLIEVRMLETYKPLELTDYHLQSDPTKVAGIVRRYFELECEPNYTPFISTEWYKKHRKQEMQEEALS